MLRWSLPLRCFLYIERSTGKPADAKGVRSGESVRSEELLHCVRDRRRTEPIPRGLVNTRCLRVKNVMEREIRENKYSEYLPLTCYRIAEFKIQILYCVV